MPLVTSARFAEWSGRRREGDRDDGQPVERSKPRVGHGGNGSLRSFAVLNTRSQPLIEGHMQATAALNEMKKAGASLTNFGVWIQG